MGILSKKAIIELVDNPNFQKWFGKSAVVDAEGLPLNVVHRVQSAPHDGPLPFTEFDPAMSRDGSGRTWFGVSDGGYARDGKEIEGFLSPENVFDIRNPDHHSIYRQWQGEYQIPQRVQNGWTEEQARAFGEKVNPGNTWSLLDPEFISWLKEKHPKFDATYESEGGYPGWAIFDPRKFKSVNNAGTFDPTDPNFLKSLGLMTAGTGAAAYAMSPDDAEAARFPWQENLLAALKDGAPKNVDFGPVESKLFQQLKSLDERYTPGDLTIPGNIVQKFIDKRIGPDGSGAESFVDDLNSLFHSSKSKALGSDFPGRQQVVNAGERMSMLGAAEPQMEGGGAVITGYPIPTKRLQRKVNSAPGGRVVSTIPSPLDGAGDQPTRLSDVGADSGQNISSDDSVVKTVVPLVWGSGLLGAGGYGLSRPDDAEASYIGPKGLVGLFGPDAAKSMLTDAERLAASGMDNEAVRQATGMFQGMDGKWRYELNDNGYKINYNGPWETLSYKGKDKFSNLQDKKYLFENYGEGKWTKNNENDLSNLSNMYRGVPLNEFISHDDIFKAYPDISNVKVSSSFDPGKSTYDGVFDTISLADKSYSDDLLHELQHAIQSREGFASGAGSQDMRSYINSSGEIEARDTAARMDLTPEQRMATPPDLRDNAIVRFDGRQASSVPQGRDWAREVGSNTPNIVQALIPNNPGDTPTPRANATSNIAIPSNEDGFVDRVVRGAQSIGTGIDEASKRLGPWVMNAPSQLVNALAKDPFGTIDQAADMFVPFKGSSKDYLNAFYYNPDSSWIDKANALAGLGLDIAFLGEGEPVKNAIVGLMR